LLKRNCAMSPRQLAKFYAAFVAITLLIGAGFTLRGAWLVLPFVGLEVLLVGVALLQYGRHAVDREYVVLDAEVLSVEEVCAGRSRVIRFNPYWVRVMSEGRSGGPGLSVWLEESQRRVVVGQYVGVVERAVFAQELKRALTAVRAGRT